MKLLKKLLPIASVASVAAIVAPIATSCANGYVIDGTKLFVPTIAKAVADADHAETGYSNEDATQLYFKNLKANPQIFVQDSLAMMSGTAYSQFQSSIYSPKDIHPALKWSFDYSQFNVDDTKGKEKLSFSVNASIYMKDMASTRASDADLSIRLEMNNIPYLVHHQNSAWAINPAMTLEELPKDASMVINASGYMYSSVATNLCVFDNETVTIDKEHTAPAERKWETITLFISSCTAISSSYHMSEIEPYMEP